MLMSVEKRTCPILIGNTGVMLPCTMAWTGMGIEGVLVDSWVAVMAGEGVITKKVGVLGAGVGLARGGRVAVGEAETEMLVRVAVAGAGTDGLRAGRFVMNSAAATTIERMPPIRDQRARTTYFCRMR